MGLREAGILKRVEVLGIVCYGQIQQPQEILEIRFCYPVLVRCQIFFDLIEKIYKGSVFPHGVLNVNRFLPVLRKRDTRKNEMCRLLVPPTTKRNCWRGKGEDYHL